MNRKLVKRVRDAVRFNMEITVADLRAIKAAATAKGLSMSAWVRLTLRKALS